MAKIAKILDSLFGHTQGCIRVVDRHDEVLFDDFNKAEAAILGMDNPSLDLVTDEGEAVGLFVAGNPAVVEPAPSIPLDEGMVFLLDGVAVPDQPTGIHMVPLDILIGDLSGEAAVAFYLPEDLNIETPASRTEITLANGRRRDELQGKWKGIKSTFGQFTDYLRDHKEGGKDGACFLQGECANGHRKAAAMIVNHILGVDLDSGAPLKDVQDTIRKHGLEAVIYTTHSHLKDTSVIKRDHFFKWSGEMVATPETVAEYLMQVKGVLPAIVEGCTILDDAQHTEEGVVILVQHQPMPKFRAVFPLAEPFVFSKRGGTQQDAIAEWKERYAGFCTDLGLFFDEKCVDPARLFYGPRHAKGSTSFGSWHIVGDPLDLDKFDRVKMKRGKDGKRRAVAQNAFTDAGEDDEDDRGRYVTESGFDLRPWAAKHAKVFEVEQMLEEVVGGEFMREPRTGGKPGVHVECPFENEHTSFGGGGTYVVNASDNQADGFEGGFTFHCVHNACSGRDRLDFLRELIDQEVITAKDLQNRSYRIELEEDEEEDDRSPPPCRNAVVSTDDDGQVLVAESIPDEPEGDDEESILHYLNRKYAVVRTSGGVRILVEPLSPEEDVTFETQNDVSLYERQRVVWSGGEKGKGKAQKFEAFKLWLEWEKRRTYRNVVFAPGRRTPKDIYNLFRGWPYAAIPTTWENTLDNATVPVKGDWSMLRAHIFENMCESKPEYFEWFMTWLAHLFQQPDRKPGSTVVVTGEKGVGKSTLFDYINQLLGRHGITVSQRKQIVGQFNGHIATCLLMVCEEAFWAADPQAEGVMKDMITNKSVLIERKGYDPIQSENYTRLALISNSEWVVPASLKDERRFFVLRCNSTRRGDLAFFGAMREQMEKHGGLEALMHDLMTWSPVNGSWSSLYNPPATSHLQQQQIESLTGVQKFMLELVKSGVYETHDDKVPAIELKTHEPTMIPAVHMRAAVEDYVRLRFASDKAKTSYDDISAVVTDWFGAQETKVAVEGQQNLRRMFRFPPLSEARAKLLETKGLHIEAMSEETVKAFRVRH